jgi:3-methyladenine DNA glycosylase AlkD
MSSITKEIQNYCRLYTNEANQVKYARYFKEGLYNGYGLTAPQIYDGVKILSKTPGLSLQILTEAGRDIIKNGKSEEISIAMLLVKSFHKEFSKETFDQITSWYKWGINNWAHADTLAMLILPLFLKKKIITVSEFSPWLTSANKFQRRSVPVTLIKILKTHENYPELFTFIECLMSDPEREVHQGTGWFLREAWKKKPSITEEFLLKWKDQAPRLIFQYATEKMSKEYRVKFRAEKKYNKLNSNR